MATFYADEQFPLKTTQHLRTLGHDVLTVQEAGNANRSIPDHEVLAFATGQNRTVLTLNRRDFIRLHQQTPDHAGIVVCKDDRDKQPAILTLNFSGIVETIISSIGAASQWQNDIFDLRTHFKRENYSHIENCCPKALNLDKQSLMRIHEIGNECWQTIRTIAGFPNRRTPSENRQRASPG